jgi:hypothetical protein
VLDAGEQAKRPRQVPVAVSQQHVTGIFAKLELGASSEDPRRVLAVLRFLDQPG